MKTKVAINQHAARAFGVRVRVQVPAWRRLRGADLGDSSAGSMRAEDEVPRRGIAAGEVGSEEVPPVDLVGSLSGDGRWVGAGGVSLLPVRKVNDDAAGCRQMRAR
jgi:hypothetical protein